MTTFAELKTQAAFLVSDPSLLTFSAVGLGYYINAGIAEVSRFCPQRFVENVDLVSGALDYALRGGVGNLVANASFETGDATVLAASTPVLIASGVLMGWEVDADNTLVQFQQSTRAKSGSRVCAITVPAGAQSKSLFQRIPVSADTTYSVSGWHWKGTTGGESNSLRFHTLDSSEVAVTTDAVRHDTTSGDPVFASGTIIVPSSGVAYIEVELVGYAAGAYGTAQAYYFEDIAVLEEGDATGVSDSSTDQIEVRRVELWSSASDVAHRVGQIRRGQDNSESGWDYWDSRLHIPYRVMVSVDPATTYLKVWGYAPYDKLTTDTQVTDLTFELEQAVMAYVKMEALSQLVFERDLFTQWQTRSGNSDVSPAALMNALSLAREDWRRKARSLLVLREGN